MRCIRHVERSIADNAGDMDNVVECIQDRESIEKRWASHAPPRQTSVLQIRLSLAHSLFPRGGITYYTK